MAITAERLCSCGSCSDAMFRAVGIIEKQLVDGECSIFIGAVGIAMAAMASDIMSRQIEQMGENKGIPPFISRLIADGAMTDTMGQISEVLRKWYESRVTKPDAPIVVAINSAIAAANKRFEAEKDLPKGG